MATAQRCEGEALRKTVRLSRLPAGSGPPPPEAGGEGDPRWNGLPVIVAVVVIVALGALFTYLGMLTQIWANMSGAQLPGA